MGAPTSLARDALLTTTLSPPTPRRRSPPSGQRCRRGRAQPSDRVHPADGCGVAAERVLGQDSDVHRKEGRRHAKGDVVRRQQQRAVIAQQHE